MHFTRQAKNMTRISLRPMLLLLAASGVILAQQTPSTSPSNNPGWRSVSDPQDQSQDQSVPPAAQQQDPPRDAYGQPQAQAPATGQAPAAQRPAYGLPPQVTLKPGTFVSMRITQKLESNKNATGDTFSGALMQPLVVDGIVVAQRGQMVYGRVAEAGKVKGTGRLGIELTGLTLADGTAASIHSQFVGRQSPIMPYGHRDEGVITTANSDGSAPPAGAPLVGVLATKGHNSVIYEQTVLTFQTANPVTIATANPNAYRYVTPDDYSRQGMNTQVAARPAGGYAPGYPYYGYPYYGYPYPYWGPAIGFGFGWGGFGGFGGFRGRFR
jgi:hypothetical protein